MTAVTHAEGIPVDTIKWHPKVDIAKWSPEQVQQVLDLLELDREPTPAELERWVEPERLHVEGNLLTTAGLDRITKLITATSSPQALTSTSGRIGVGDTNTAAAVGNTDLAAAAGSTHRFFMTLNSLSQANGVITASAIFGINDGNFAWQEWCIDVGTPTVTSGTTVNACMLNRAVQSLGTKVSGAIWTFTVTLTLS